MPSKIQRKENFMYQNNQKTSKNSKKTLKTT